MKTNQQANRNKITKFKQQRLHQSQQYPLNFSSYQFQDYTFLNQYELIDSIINTQTQFLAKIKDTQQYVKFIKKQYLPAYTQKGRLLYKRFQSLFSLFQKGLILADNMFILQQGNKKFYYYIIEPYLQRNPNIDSSFITLQQYLYENKSNIHTFSSRKNIFFKCKNLIDNLISTQESYCGLNTKNIIIDDQGNVYLMPFNLQPQLNNHSYQRSYYPIEILNLLLGEKQGNQRFKSMIKWDLWSFGCVAAQIFIYLTPFFMSTSIQQQIKRIRKQTKVIFEDLQEIIKMQPIDDQYSECSVEQRIKNQKQQNLKILTFFRNVFNMDQNKRNMSFQSPVQISTIQKTQRTTNSRFKRSIRKMLDKQKEQNNQKQKQNHLKNTQKSLTSQINFKNNLTQTKENSIQFIEINVCEKIENNHISQNKETYKLQIKFMSLQLNLSQLSDLHHLQQLAIKVQFSNSRKYQFYIDTSIKSTSFQINKFKANAQQKIIPINKKLTISHQSLQSIERLLQDDLQFSIQQTSYSQNDRTTQNSQLDSLKQFNSQIFLNLSALVLKNDSNKRIWKKPIKGTYKSQCNSQFSCKIKVQASLVNQNEPNQIEEEQQKETTMKKSNIATNMSRKEPLNNKSISSQLNKRESSSPFSKINKQIQQISKFWKQKIEDKDQKQFIQQNLALKQRKPQISNRNSYNKLQKLLKMDQNMDKNQKNATNLSKATKQNNMLSKSSKSVDISLKLKKLLIN